MKKIKFLMFVASIATVGAIFFANIASACSSGWGEVKAPDHLVD